MPLAWKDRIKVASATTGTGTLTLGSAASGYRSFAAGDDGKLFPYVIEDGTAWETGYGTYTHSGTTFARTTRTDSSTGSAISCSGAENLFVQLIAARQTANELADQTYICGLIVTKHTGANTLDISAGSCYDPSSQKIINYAGVSGLSAGTLGASQWNQVYLYDNAGTVTPEVVNNANPPSTAYAGTARQGGTNSNRRWIGSFLTDGSSNLYTQDMKEIAANAFLVVWLTATVSPFRILSAGTATSFTAVSAAGCVPRYAASEALINHIVDNGTATLLQGLDMSIDGTNRSGNYNLYSPSTGTFPTCTGWDLLEVGTPQLYYKLTAVGTPKAYLDISAYKASR